MERLVLGLLLVGVNGLVIWCISEGATGILPLWNVVLASAILNLTLGIRIGYSYADAYLVDATRLNRHLAAQNDQLIQANQEWIARFKILNTAEETEPGASGQGMESSR